MLIKWIKKKILSSIVDDVIKSMPEIKEMALLRLEVYKDELLDFVKEKLKEVIQEFIKSYLD